MTTFQNIQLKLAGSRSGRIALHLVCALRDRKFYWHLSGIVRELTRSKLPGGCFRFRQVRRLDGSALARGVAAIHDTVFITRVGKSAV